MNKENFLIDQWIPVHLICSPEENSAVKYAVENMCTDIKKVFECDCDILWEKRLFEDNTKNHRKKTNICIATLDVAKESWDKEVLSALSWEKLYQESGDIRWEAYLQQIIDGTLYILGSDRRGAVFGIYDMCDRFGVSPWEFWADVPVRKKKQFLLDSTFVKVDWPDVMYRGIFLNDEEELDAWAKLHTKDDTIGPETYQKIFELILRLKGNYIWPAMHVNYFNENPRNAKLADKMGVVVGTSHCDMLMRSNQNEWEPWIQEKGYSDLRYDYSIQGENRERLKEYWRESVQINEEYEVCYTVGMRGIHDYGFSTVEIDHDQTLTKEEKKKRKVQLLERVIKDQRAILQEVLGEERGTHALQSFIPYKEVLDLYDEGLELPDDITTIWVDDNFGYMRRYPTKEERGRKGGHGLYYHASYWAAPGMSYLFYNSMPLAQMGNELKKCWESGIQKMWVLNVGALKPLEIDIDYFLKYGWYADRAEEKIADTDQYLSTFINQTLETDWGERMAVIYNRFAQVNHVCKLEHLQSDKFCQEGIRNEAKERLEVIEKYLLEAEAIYEKLPECQKNCFFEFFLMKMQASYYINGSFYHADRSNLMYEKGGMQAADAHLRQMRELDNLKQEMIFYYNHVLQEGKWNGILTPESFSPPPTVLLPAARPALYIGEAQLGGFMTGNSEFTKYGLRERTITLFNKGAGCIRFEIEAPEWLALELYSGEVSEELAINVSINTEKVFERNQNSSIVVHGEYGERIEFQISTKKMEQVPEWSDDYYMEGDHVVSIPAEGYQHCRNSENTCFRKVLGIGRMQGNDMEVYRKTIDSQIDFSCYLDYFFFVESEGSPILEIQRYLTLNPKGRVRFAVAFDDKPCIMIESDITDEWRGNWKEAVMNDGEKILCAAPFLSKGLHRMRIYPIDQYVTLHKFVLYMKGRLESNLGPDYSVKCSQIKDNRLRYRREQETQNTEKWHEIYGNPRKELLLLPMLYAPIDFWEKERLYTRSEERAEILGKEKYKTDCNSRKNVFEHFGKGVFLEENGILEIEAEYALEQSENAYLTKAKTIGRECFTHTQAETDGQTGFAMMIRGNKLRWDNPLEAPGMHYKIRIGQEGGYTIWILMKFEDLDSDTCRIAIDEKIVPKEDMSTLQGNFFTYSMKQRWHWRAVTKIYLKEGEHTLSILGEKSGLRLDRIFLTQTEELPPLDRDWKESKRNG